MGSKKYKGFYIAEFLYLKSITRRCHPLFSHVTLPLAPLSQKSDENGRVLAEIQPRVIDCISAKTHPFLLRDNGVNSRAMFANSGWHHQVNCLLSICYVLNESCLQNIMSVLL